MSWDAVRLEILKAPGATRQDDIRRRKLSDVESITGIPLIIYAVDFIDESRAGQYGAGLQVDMVDKVGFMQALSDVPNGPLDVLLHSPGGSPTATEAIVELLRSRFDPIRFLVPHAAKSAATMLALSGDEILLGEGAELGPIDPQLRVTVDQRSINVPAGAAIDQFARIQDDVAKDAGKVRGWLPIIRQYGPSFLQECHNAVELSQTLVAEWLQRFMLEGEDNAEAKATAVATWLSEHANFNSHARPVWMQQLLGIEPSLRIKRFRDISAEFNDAVMELYWAIDITFDMTGAFKIIEHQAGSAFIRLQQVRAPNQAGPQPKGRPAPKKSKNRRRRP